LFSVPGSARRWAATAAAAVLVLLTGSAAAVVASSDALPGDALYPVKRTTEDITLALTFSESSKASRHLEFAERRAREMANIADSAGAGLIASTAGNLEEHLGAALRIISSIESDSTAAQLAGSLRASWNNGLSALQGVSGNNEAYVAASEAYGRALEGAAERQEDTYVAAPPSILRLELTDPPPEGVEELVVEVTKVEVFLPAGEHSHWVTVLDSPRKVDLIRAAEAPVLLAESSVESGSYSRIRFELSSATIVVAGASQTVDLSTRQIEIIRPFSVQLDEVTAVALDFDSAASLSTEPTGGYSLAPDVKVIAREPSPGRSQVPPSPTPAVSSEPEASPTPDQGLSVEITGVVERISSNAIVVNGVEIALGPAIRLDAQIEEGSSVTVRATLERNGRLTGTEITLATPSGPGTTPAPTTVPSDVAVIEGPVSRVGFTEWVVDGQRVTVTGDTQITLEGLLDPGIAIEDLLGIRVRVEGVRESDGSITATRIAPVLGQDTQPTPAPSSTPPPPLPLPPSPSPGAASTATPAEPAPTELPTPAATAAAELEQITGTLTAIGDTEWAVGGQQVLITAATVIEGLPLVGRTVTVTGTPTEDGGFIATLVVFGEPDVTATPETGLD
jgi:hypothetical protein